MNLAEQGCVAPPSGGCANKTDGCRTTALQKEDTPYSFSVPSKENATILRLPRLPDTGVSVQPSGDGYPVVIVLHLR